MKLLAKWIVGGALFVPLVVVVVGYATAAADLSDHDGDGYTGLALPSGETSAVLELPPASMLVDRSHFGTVVDIRWGFMGHLQTQGWTITEEFVGPITDALLSQYDVLMITPNGVLGRGILPFSASEAAAVASFVAAGGGLWVFSEYDRYPAGVNTISAQFGVTFNQGLVNDASNNRGQTSWPDITDIQSHQITIGVSSFGYYAGCCLNVESPAMILATGDNDATSASCPAGSFPPVLAVYENAVGGCAVFMGDTTPLNGSFYPDRLDAEEELLLLNIAKCLAPGGAVQIEPTTWGSVKVRYR